MAAGGFHDFVCELFGGVGAISVKRMFGGAGVYAEGLMFGLIFDETIYVKVDAALKAELSKEGCGPFIWSPSNGPRAGEKVEMGYWRLPDAALDDPDLATQWGRKALNVARAKATSTKKQRTKR